MSENILSFGFFFLGECQKFGRVKVSRNQVDLFLKAFLQSVWEQSHWSCVLNLQNIFQIILFFFFSFWTHWALGHGNIVVEGYLQIDKWARSLLMDGSYPLARTHLGLIRQGVKDCVVFQRGVGSEKNLKHLRYVLSWKTVILIFVTVCCSRHKALKKPSQTTGQEGCRVSQWCRDDLHQHFFSPLESRKGIPGTGCEWENCSFSFFRMKLVSGAKYHQHRTAGV